MSGRRFPRAPWLLVGMVAAACVFSPGTAVGGSAATGHGSGQLAEEDPVPSWCHHNLQLVFEPTRSLGFRDATVLKGRFGTARTYYRAFAADEDIHVFSAEAHPTNGFDFDAFVASMSTYEREDTKTYKCFASVSRVSPSNIQTVVWGITDYGLVSVAASNPDNPSALQPGEVDLDQSPSDVVVRYVQHSYSERWYVIYAANGANGVGVYSIVPSYWTQTDERGTIDTPGDAVGLALEDSVPFIDAGKDTVLRNLLFVADATGGVQVVDVTDIDSLSILASYATFGPARQLTVVDSLLFVAEWDAGVEILNIASVESIFPVAHLDTPGLAYEVAVQDSFLFVADWDGGVRMYNFARPDDIFLHGFYGIGGMYHSVAVADSLVFAGDHSGLKVLRVGEDREPPVLSSTVTQTPYLRSYLRTYALASECLAGAPTAKHLILPRQTTVEDFEGYADNDTLRGEWVALRAPDSVSIATPGYEGAQAMELDFSVTGGRGGWVALTFDEPYDWTYFDRLALQYKGGGDSDTASLAVKVFTADGDSLMGDPAAEATVASDWQEYWLDLSTLDPRDNVEKIDLGVIAPEEAPAVSGSILFDHVVLRRVSVDTEAKGSDRTCLGDTLDVEMTPVSEERHLYVGDFRLVASDTGMTNVLLITATDNSGNSSSIATEFRAQLIVPVVGGVLPSPDSRFSLEIPPDAISSEAFFYVIPRDPHSAQALPGQDSHALGQLPPGARVLGKLYEAGLTGRSLRVPVDAVFRPRAGELEGLDPAELGVYRWEDGAWVFVGGRFDAAEGNVRVSLTELGTLTLMANPNKPELGPAQAISLRCYPNPFNPTTTLSYVCPLRAHVSLKIYDVKGQLVRTLVDGAKNASTHFVTWNGRTDGEAPVTSGVYFARLEIGREIHSVKLVLIR